MAEKQGPAAVELTDSSFGQLASRLSDLADETTATLKEQVPHLIPSTGARLCRRAANNGLCGVMSSWPSGFRRNDDPAAVCMVVQGL